MVYTYAPNFGLKSERSVISGSMIFYILYAKCNKWKHDILYYLCQMSICHIGKNFGNKIYLHLWYPKQACSWIKIALYDQPYSHS